MTDNAPTHTNQLEALAQAHENEAFALLVDTVRDPEAKLEHRLKAAERILDQARGKPKVAQAKDPSQKKTKAVSMSVETLLKIAQGAISRAEIKDANLRKAATLEAEFTPKPRPRPVNQYALPPPAQVPGTTDDDADTDDLLS